MDLEKLKYPIGQYNAPETLDMDIWNGWVAEIGQFPAEIRKLAEGLSEEELAYRYRPEGWNIRQLIHHCSDSHMNALIRIKWVLTEDSPTIKAYNEAKWAELPDTLELAPEVSLAQLEVIHVKIVHLLKGMKKEEWDRVFFHPEVKGALQIGKYMGLYAWHGNHHLAHIRQALEMKFS